MNKDVFRLLRVPIHTNRIRIHPNFDQSEILRCQKMEEKKGLETSNEPVKVRSQFLDLKKNPVKVKQIRISYS
jgi:hypothetical protein